MTRLLLAFVLAGNSFVAYAGFELHTALGDNSAEPEFIFQDTFTCTDTVFTVVDISDNSPGSHTLGIRWFDPSGERREFTRHEFWLQGASDRVWGWLKLSRAPGAGLLRWLDSSAGMEEFIGEWRIEVEIDDQPAGNLGFDVIC